MITPIPIDKGVFKAQNPKALRNSPFSENLINLFVDEAGGNVDRPTLQLFATLASIKPIGMRWFSGVLVVVTSDRLIYSIDASGNMENITGDNLYGTGRPTFATDGTKLYIAGGSAPLKWAGPGNLTALLGGSPPNMTHIVYLDGYLIGNRRLDSENNKVTQFADFEATETWTGTNFFSNNASPDEGQGIATSQRDLYCIGEETTEIWQNVGTSPIPFSRAYTYEYGTHAPYSIISEDNSVFFLNQHNQILRFLGRAPTRISEAIEQEIGTYSKVSDCVASSFRWKGTIHVLFCFPTEEKAWSIDLKNNQWTEWKGYDNDGYSRVRINALWQSIESDVVYAGDYNTGKVFTFSDTEKTDAGGIFKRQRTFAHFDGGSGVRKRSDIMRVKLNRDVASAYSGTTSQTNPTLELRWKDAGAPWSEYRRSSLGQKGELKEHVEFRRLGIYRSRQYELQISDPAALSIASVETDDTVLSS